MPNRISWNEYALQLAEVASLRSPDPYKKVGACALDHENRVIGLGYNGLAKGKEVDNNFWSDREKRRPFMIHAEMNLLSLLRRGECKVLASTLLPCSCCANIIAAHDVKTVVFSEIYLNDNAAFDIFQFHGIELIQIGLDGREIYGNFSPDFDEIL